MVLSSRPQFLFSFIIFPQVLLLARVPEIIVSTRHAVVPTIRSRVPRARLRGVGVCITAVVVGLLSVVVA